MDTRPDDERSERPRAERRQNTAGLLSLDVDLHPSIDPDGFLIGSLKVKGGLRCDVDVQAGDRLSVQIANADGQVIASAELRGLYPHFTELKERGHVIGTERVNRAEVYEDAS